MSEFQPIRRRFLQRLLLAGAGLALAGCDRLSRNARFTRLLESAEGFNQGVQRALAGEQALAREFTEADLSEPFPANGSRDPRDREYHRLLADGFAQWRLEVGGLVARPQALSLDELRALPARTQITRHDCVEGWSAIAKWQGARLSALLERVEPLPAARYVVFHCYDIKGDGARYYESIDFFDALHEQTILAYAWNDRPLPVPYGAPLRLRVERQLGYKMAKYLHRIELVDDLKAVNGGNGGYWEDRGYAWYAGI